MEQQQSLIALFAQLTPWVQALVIMATFGSISMAVHAAHKTIIAVVTDIAVLLHAWRGR